MGKVDDAGRAIAGLLTYNPGPGIYSRLERAIEAMPENVRVQELPGLLRRYKDGVPGWEVKETDLDSVIAGRDVVPREELLARVKERSPVYTHKEVVLGGNPPLTHLPNPDRTLAESQRATSPLGEGIYHGEPNYKDYGQGGTDYAELLISQPGADGSQFGSHWANKGWGWRRGADEAVAHARYDTHGDALRINELQSDLGIHNRKAREYAAQNPQTSIVDGQHVVQNDPSAQGLPFPLEDSWSDLLIKRLALEAARKGHRAIEVASPRSIADKVGGNIENYEHFYGKVVPGALERLGRKMGGLTLEDSGMPLAKAAEQNPAYAYHDTFRDQMREATGEDQLGPQFWRLYSGMRYDSLPPSQQAMTYDRFGGSHPVSQSAGGTPQDMYEYLHKLGLAPEHAQRITSQAMYLAPHNARDMHSLALREQLESVGQLARQPVADSPRRYLMSDEMRRRLIEGGVGAAVATGIMSQDDLINRLNQ
jgi:hypothetical protein